MADYFKNIKNKLFSPALFSAYSTNQKAIFFGVCLYIFLFVTGALGIRFGSHWDEYMFVRQIDEAFKTGIYLPHNYVYPSFCFYYSSVLAFLYKSFVPFTGSSAFADQTMFYMFSRLGYLALSALTVFWLVFTVLKLTGSLRAALIGGLIFCSSFEFSYHSRWAVSDGIAVQFVFLSVFILFTNLRFRKKIILSTIVAGIAAGTKYTAAFILLIFIFYILHEYKEKRISGKQCLTCLLCIPFLFLSSFIFITPGVIFEFNVFFSDVVWVNSVYSTGHLGHTIHAGKEHFLRIIEYLTLELFSGNTIISVLFFLCAVAGTVYAVIRKNSLIFLLFIVPFFYIFYLSSFSAMIVRNILYVLPFFSALAALGYFYMTEKRHGKLKNSITIILVFFTFYSCFLNLQASTTIGNRSVEEDRILLKEFTGLHPDAKFILSKKVQEQLNMPCNNDTSEYVFLAYYLSEVPPTVSLANIRGQFAAMLGPQDINIDYYPNWCGKDRILVMEKKYVTDSIYFYTR